MDLVKEMKKKIIKSVKFNDRVKISLLNKYAPTDEKMEDVKDQFETRIAGVGKEDISKHNTRRK